MLRVITSTPTACAFYIIKRDTESVKCARANELGAWLSVHTQPYINHPLFQHTGHR